MGVIAWMQKRPTDEVKGWLKKASDQGDFPLSNRLSIRYIHCLIQLMTQNTSSAGNAQTEVAFCMFRNVILFSAIVHLLAIASSL